MKGTTTAAPEGFSSHQSTIFFSNGAAAMNQRKRGREAPAPATTILSTGLRLAVEGEKHSQAHNHSSLSVDFSGDIAAKIKQEKEEIERFLHSQGEELQRTLAERRRRHRGELLRAAEEAAARQLREREAAAELAARRGAELEHRLAGLRSESMAWQAKAAADGAAVASLHAQLQQAAAAASPQGCRGEANYNELAAAGDEESACVDPRRMELLLPWRKACRACRVAGASVVALPCRHLSLCTVCAVASPSCPVCHCPQSGSVQVFLF